MDTPFLQYKTWMTARYGEPLFRIPLDLGGGCPNRAPDGSGGCAFCNERGARAVQITGRETVREQIAAAVEFARRRYRARSFMAYVQAFSASFEPERQDLYREILREFPFRAVTFGTRPDCITPEALDFLARLNRDIETWVELGVQTVHDATLRRIRRGHDWAASRAAILRLHEAGVRVAVHVILGLPGETLAHFRRTAETLAALPLSGIKIHNLHILRETALAAEYARRPFPVFSEHAYAEILIDFLRRLPPDLPIIRLTTDSPPEERIAPAWHMSKGEFLDYLIRHMIWRAWRQGDLFPRRPKAAASAPAESAALYRPVRTADGSLTFWNETFREHYHAPVGARLEAFEKYVRPARLAERLRAGPVRLLDVCFGLGYNTLAALETAAAAPFPLHVTALEADRRVLLAAAERMDESPRAPFSRRRFLAALAEPTRLLPPEPPAAFAFTPNAACRLLLGDARYTVRFLPPAAFDLIFLDPFSTQRNSELWTVDFFRRLRRLLKPGGALLTYCAALPVRSGLIEAGFHVGETRPVGRKRPGTVAALDARLIRRPLSEEERALLRTPRGLPYRDPHGILTNREILRDRQERLRRLTDR